jgi:hypothetical protein
MLRNRIAPAILCLGLLSGAVAHAQEPWTNGLDLVGSAEIVRPSKHKDKILRLTHTSQYMAGAAWLKQKQKVSGGFETEFNFQLTWQGGVAGADGFAFALQNSGPQALGNIGSAGGFALGEKRYRTPKRLPQSIAVFFDTFQNPESGDPSGNYIAICTGGRSGEMKWPPTRLMYNRNLSVDLKDGRMHKVQIFYHQPILSVVLDGKTVLLSTVDLSTVIDADGASYVGFTASTGAGWQNHDILNWSFQPELAPAVSSNLTVVSSDILYLQEACLPDRNLCTPERSVVKEIGTDTYHLILPANLPWGVSIPNPAGHPVVTGNAKGVACWNVAALGSHGCNGADSIEPQEVN